MQTRPDRDRVWYATEALLASMSSESAAHPRGRVNLDLHDWADPYQRMLHAIQPGSYVQPHRHRDPGKSESFVALAGEIAFFVFEEDGALSDARRIGPRCESKLVDIRPGVWHSLAALVPGTILFEGKNGPYDPRTDKEFAPWAPAEGDPAAKDYLAGLLRRLP
ncbi:MAG: WbuC family cupin fold metalloprotein [Candidatus Eisenbacteria bacterium]|nr:WbuC family cupin fold metalloprotein [Candidatus Eisenbacteria bacterium]